MPTILCFNIFIGFANNEGEKLGGKVMKKKGITLALLLSCTTAAAAPALPSTNSDLRALEQNKAQTPQQAELTSVQTEGDLSLIHI